jgi:hypothetical protein
VSAPRGEARTTGEKSAEALDTLCVNQFSQCTAQVPSVQDPNCVPKMP